MEQWMPIKGYENYSVSYDGRISNKNGVMKMFVSRYTTVNLYGNSKRVIGLVHRLVAIAFVPNPHGYKYVNHLDGDKQNNAAWNLEWCTAKMNNAHAIRTGLTPKAEKGEMASGAKLTEAEATELLQIHSMYGLNQTRTAKEYGLCQATIGELIRRETWKHIQI